ncbi:MAG: YeeE/YedE thiosulfate transporter family protein [Pseudomonadales bacterium]
MTYNNNQTFGSALMEGHASLFGKQWAAWIGGILLALVNIMMFAYEKPWSAAGGVRNWGDWVFNTLDITDKIIIPPHLYSTSLLNFGVIVGAFAAALLARQFRLRGAPPFEITKGLVGGTLMGIGAALAFGCNIGGFFSAISALSMAGVAMMLGLMIGVYIGLRLLILEVNYLDFSGANHAPTATKSDSSSWTNKQPIIGALVLAGILGLAFIYDGFDYPTRGGFLLFGLFLGIVMQRTRFCFVRAFREPFLTGDTEMTKAVIIAVVISVIGFSILKWTDLRDLDTAVSVGFWFGSLVGGIIFGIGMSLSGGCATGCLWRAGEGQIKLWIVIVAFALSTSLFRIWLEDSGWIMKLGKPVFLPDVVGWKLAIITVIGIMLLWYLIVVWNEVKRKLIVAL